MTPAQQGITQRTCETPAQGWRVSSWYIANVACSEHNVFHQSLIFSGDTTEGTSAKVFNPSYEDGLVELASCFVVRQLHLLDLSAAWTVDDPAALKLMPRSYYLGEITSGDITLPALAFSGFLSDPLGLPGNYSMVVYTTPGGQLTCRPYRDSRFRVLCELFTQDELNTTPEAVACRLTTTTTLEKD